MKVSKNRAFACQKLKENTEVLNFQVLIPMIRWSLKTIWMQSWLNSRSQKSQRPKKEIKQLIMLQNYQIITVKGIMFIGKPHL